ncbi:MAG TPA: MarR family transcriptional regulator [Candidatus Adamsella sp.]|nr:MarR family transcriptional regulator [Candidatus Adamsella sp.]
MKKFDENYTTYTQSLEFAAELLTKAIKETMRKVDKEMNFKVSHEEYIILETVCLNPGIIQIDIAKKIFMQRSYVGKLLAKLEESGYIKRTQSIKGKKKVVMKSYITDSGIEAYNEVKDWILEEINKNSISEESRRQTKEMIKHMFEIVTYLREEYDVKL